jgi:hypothetical protein
MYDFIIFLLGYFNWDIAADFCEIGFGIDDWLVLITLNKETCVFNNNSAYIIHYWIEYCYITFNYE